MEGRRRTETETERQRRKERGIDIGVRVINSTRRSALLYGGKAYRPTFTIIRSEESPGIHQRLLQRIPLGPLV